MTLSCEILVSLVGFKMGFKENDNIKMYAAFGSCTYVISYVLTKGSKVRARATLWPSHPF